MQLAMRREICITLEKLSLEHCMSRSLLLYLAHQTHDLAYMTNL